MLQPDVQVLEPKEPALLDELPPQEQPVSQPAF